jgi:hypothetical protein
VAEKGHDAKGKGAAAGTSSRASLEETCDVHGARVASSGKPLVEPTQRKAAFVLIAAPADHDAVAWIFQVAAMVRGLDVVPGWCAIGIVWR